MFDYILYWWYSEITSSEVGNFPLIQPYLFMFMAQFFILTYYQIENHEIWKKFL